MPKLIPDWRRAWRLLSVQIAGALVLWGALPPDQQQAIVGLIPGLSPERVPAVLGLLVIVGRLVQQAPSGTEA